MDIHYYHKETKLFTHSGSARANPKVEDGFLVPAFTTANAVPILTANQAAQFDVKADNWRVIPDYRGHTYWLADGSEHHIDDVDIVPPVGQLSAKPDSYLLDELKAVNITVLSAACTVQIKAGLASSALGAEHIYDTDKDTDQTNLLAAGLSGVDIDFTCTDIATETKIPRPHTAAQIRQVFEEARDEKVRLVGLYHSKRSEVEAVAITTTLEAAQAEINAIAWTG